MIMNISLEFPNESLKDSFMKFLDISFDIPKTLDLVDNSFTDTLSRIRDYSNAVNLPENFVPCTTLWGVEKNTMKIIGGVIIRHYLNEYLNFKGGHIGYYVTPSERNKGYGALLLYLALEKCKKINLNKILITCDEDNIGSNKIIIKNGGILQSKEVDFNGNLFNRYLISKY